MANRFEITQSRDQLILHLQQHLDILRCQRSILQTKQKKTQIIERLIIPYPQLSKYQLQKTINDNRSKLKELEEEYKRKKYLDSLAMQQIPTVKKIKPQRIIEKQKAQKQVIKQQTKIAQQYVKQQRLSKKQQIQQKKLYFSSVISKIKGQPISIKINNILNKPKVSLLDEQFMLVTIFQSLKVQNQQTVRKQDIKEYFTYNPKVADYFHITKRQLTKDLQVHGVGREQQLELNYKQFFEFVKSIQITYRSMNPSKVAIKQNFKQTSFIKQSKQKPKQSSKYQDCISYLTTLFSELDIKNQKIVQRQIIVKFILSPTPKLPKSVKLLAKIDKTILTQFHKRMKNVPKHQQYYKQLSLTYLSLNQLIQEFKYFYEKKYKKKQTKKLIQSIQIIQIPKSQIDYYQNQHFQQAPEQCISYSISQRNPLDTDYQVQSTDYNKIINREQLLKFDKFYKKVQKQYKDEIKNDITQQQKLAEEFNKLQMYIGYMDKKMAYQK